MGERRHEIEDVRRETVDRRQEMEDVRQETSHKTLRSEMRDGSVTQYGGAGAGSFWWEPV